MHAKRIAPLPAFQRADVRSWLALADAGVTCILVKYRVPSTACNWNRDTRRHEQPEIPMALQDAQRAISLVRHHAAAYGIDPDRIGMMGFSAGGHLAVLSSTRFGARSYAPIDAIDQASSRPDFAIPVYPGHMTMEHKNKTPKDVAAQELNTHIIVSARIPPTLLIHARDDTVDPVHYSEVYARTLKKAGLDVTLNLYATGGHAFGVSKQRKDTDRWMDDALGDAGQEHPLTLIRKVDSDPQFSNASSISKMAEDARFTGMLASFRRETF